MIYHSKMIWNVYQLLFLCFLVMVVPIDSEGQCKGGAPCVVIQQCPGLCAELPKLKINITGLVKKLYCGNDSRNQPMICCPTEYLVDPEKRNVCATSLLPNLNVCGIQNDARIIGGNLTELDEFPWMALIRYDYYDGRRTGYKCGGVLISSRYVLTAAHCVTGPAFSDMKLTQVRLGEWDLSSTIDCIGADCNTYPLDVLVEKIIPHENFDPFEIDHKNDIALLRLSKEVSFTDFITPICLPIAPALRTNSFLGYDMVVAGWGQTEFSDDLSDIKRKVAVPVVSNDICNLVYKNLDRKISPTQICAGGRSARDSCKGDSGGPLMGPVSSAGNWMAIGVVSYGANPCGSVGIPGVYTRVTSYIDWILSKLEA